MLGLLVPLLGLALAYFALLDGWYLVRLPCAVLHARLLQPRVRDLLAEQRYAGRVLPSDLDLLLHMNNARYLREADVARTVHLARCGVLEALRALGGRTVLAASCARYRRSLRLLEPFEVRTRLLGWDDRAFYLEARFISLRDGFVCALLRSRQHVLGTSPECIVQHLCKRKSETEAEMQPGARGPSPGPASPSTAQRLRQLGARPWGQPSATEAVMARAGSCCRRLLETGVEPLSKLGPVLTAGCPRAGRTLPSLGRGGGASRAARRPAALDCLQRGQQPAPPGREWAQRRWQGPVTAPPPPQPASAWAGACSSLPARGQRGRLGWPGQAVPRSWRGLVTA
ncbi:protein THEM6 isoform X1 [Phyllostomus hastatus]|uniref:protein THEM6 isoform X1 n=1 Tax=Phyllostomus hastatus TaxID=9423 RepID=UPI001E67F157|nr:protein THEM6 isoform X1 [Phyllostomus hastatus]